MESHRRLGGFRTLLPFEVKLCESIGITDKEYFEFLDLVDAKPVEADIVAGPAAGAFALYTGTIGTSTFALTFLGQVVVSVALAAISYLLTPKPKTPSQAPRLEIGGVQGRSRFNPTSGFESLQDLASLGSFIPLVYAKSRNSSGGVRISSQLLWSQVRTAQYGESISAIVLFSNGAIGAKPQFNSLALGETFLTDLPLSKLKVYFSRGKNASLNRLEGVSDEERSTLGVNDDQYQEGSALNENNYNERGRREYSDDDPFKVKVFAESYNSDNQANFSFKPSFSATKTPSTSNKFGLHTPLPNGNAYKVPWELLMNPKGQDDGVGKDTRFKMGKVMHKYPRLVGITNHGDSYFYGGAGDGVLLTPDQVKGAIDSTAGDLSVVYRIYHAAEETAWIDSSIDTTGETIRAKKWNKFSPWGSADAKSVADTTREGVDDAIQVGEQYMVGSTLMTAFKEDNGHVWIPDGLEGFTKSIFLKADEPGYLEFRNTGETDGKGIAMPYESLIVQKADLAVFSNTKECDVTEIGIKSTVFRQINGFPNVNELPSQDRIASYENKGGSIQLGQVSKYVKRLSFFKVQAKKINSGDPFIDITSKVFCVQGSSPTAHYNAIFINHDKPSQYEFRFLPVAGNVVLNHFDDRVVHVLGYAERLQSDHNDTLGLTISYHAKEGQLPLKGSIDEGSNLTNNLEWNRGGLGAALPVIDADGNVIEGVPVNSFFPTTEGVDVFQPPQYSYITGAFIPDGVTSYFGNGPGSYPASYTQQNNASNYNYRGTPAADENGVVGNAYFSPQKGIAAVAIPVSAEIWTWHFIFGGTLIPRGANIGGNLQAGYKPDGRGGEADWFGPVEEVDADGNGTGNWHRFRVALDPFGGEDWRRTDADGNYIFGVAVQKADRPSITTSTEVKGTQRISGQTGSGLFVAVTTKTDGVNTYRTFALQSPGDLYFTGTKVTVNDIGTTLTVVSKDKPDIAPDLGNEHSDWSTDGTGGFYTAYWEHIEHNPNNAIADYFLFDAENSSHENGPEHEVTYVNEIIHAEASGIGQIQYEKLAIAGIRIGASGSLNSFNSFSAFIQQGITVDRLIPDVNPNSGTGYRTIQTNPDLFESTDNFVEIVYDLLTNKEYGAGDLIGHDGVDRVNMIEGARYCRANNFTWNGVIDNKFNLREFIFEHAAYNFLDFSILGGRFSLKPSFPIDGDYKINYQAKVSAGIDVRALFTDGNMKDIKITFLTPEERKMFKATVIYRDEKVNSEGIAGFPEDIAKTYAYNPTNEHASTFFPKAEKLPEEVFDLSNWCNNEEHAKLFAAIALSIRKEVDHGIVISTPPSSVFNLMAGDYIRVLTEATHTSRFNNGSIDKDGIVISRSTITGEINVYAWSPGDLDGVEKKTFSVDSNGENTAGLKNKLFAQVDTTEEDRIYKVESITYGEEGLIQVAGSHVPLINNPNNPNDPDNGKLAVLYNAQPEPVNNVSFIKRFPELRK